MFGLSVIRRYANTIPRSKNLEFQAWIEKKKVQYRRRTDHKFCTLNACASTAIPQSNKLTQKKNLIKKKAKEALQKKTQKSGVANGVYAEEC